MLAATLKGTFIIGMAAGQLSASEPVAVEKLEPLQQTQPKVHYLLEVELYEGDDIIVRWL